MTVISFLYALRAPVYSSFFFAAKIYALLSSTVIWALLKHISSLGKWCRPSVDKGIKLKEEDDGDDKWGSWICVEETGVMRRTV